jgi:hypothetical protein
MGFFQRVIDLLIITLWLSFGVMYLIFRDESIWGSETASLIGGLMLAGLVTFYLFGDYTTEFWQKSPNIKLVHWVWLVLPVVFLVIIKWADPDTFMFSQVWQTFLVCFILCFFVLIIMSNMMVGKKDDIPGITLILMIVFFVLAAVVWYMEFTIFDFTETQLAGGLVIAGLYTFFTGANAVT